MARNGVDTADTRHDRQRAIDAANTGAHAVQVVLGNEY